MTRGDAEQRADRAVAGVPDGVVRQIAGLTCVLRHLDEALDREGPRTLLPLDSHPADFRLRRLADEYDLTQAEADLLLLALAPGLDGRYGRLFGRLRGDPTRHRPTVALAADLMGLTPAQRLAVPLVLDPGAPLLRGGLLRLEDPAGMPDCPLPERELAVDDRVAGFVTGSDAPAEGLTGMVDVVDLGTSGHPLVLAESVRNRLDVLAAGPPRPVHLRGPDGSGRQAAAESLARAWGFPVLLWIRSGRLPLDEPDRLGPVLRSIGREARLRGAVPFWEDVDVLLDEHRAAAGRSVEEAIARNPCVVVASRDPWPRREGPPMAEVVLRRPDAAQRIELWRRALGPAGGHVPADDLAAVAGAFRLGPAAIAGAAAEALAGGSPVTAAGLAAVARRHGAAVLTREAQRVDQSFDWDDLVLPEDRLQRLRALGDRLRHRALVHDRWGFAATLGAARGVAALFTGPSGTGKTMAAGVLARTVGLDLYRVDLAGVVSKYIGETEQNLARVFAAAEAADVVLFFDEADALFGKRTEVRDAHDRYANVEVAYLLQRIEAHDGVVVLATNLRKNVDEAFLRRLQFVVEFPLPDKEHRLRIWRQIWPAAAPLDPALDLTLLADRYELTGGSIRNVAVEAAFAAAAAGCPIGPAQIWPALRHEHQKLGRVPADDAWPDQASGPPSSNGYVPLARSAR
jgi:MoxR-like ATPase